MTHSSLYCDAKKIWEGAIESVMPEKAVRECLKTLKINSGKLVVIAIGKAGWTMAKAASDFYRNRIDCGVVATKYGHSKGAIDRFEIIEAGHPYMDEQAVCAAKKAIKAVDELDCEATVLFLISGGGSALFELPAVPFEELQDINRRLLACGADIEEINTIRKRLSLVKGGRFARLCGAARVVTIVLSDVVGDRLDMIASGPTSVDSSSAKDALSIAKKYGLELSDTAAEALLKPLPKALLNTEYYFCGNVRKLCEAAKSIGKELGYEARIVNDSLNMEAAAAGKLIAGLARKSRGQNKRLALIFGGETVVRLTGNGKGGRNQELALSAAKEISGLDDVAVFSVGSDGTDGPTDAAGGYVDGSTRGALEAFGIDIDSVLWNNDSYNALKRTGSLIFTGPTGTNVCDLSVALIEK